MSQAARPKGDQIPSLLSAFHTRAWEASVWISLDTRMYLDVDGEFDRLETRISTEVLALEGNVERTLDIA